MALGAIVGGLLTLYGNNQANKGNKKAADATTKTQMQAIEEERRQYDLSRGDYKPFMEAGYDALGRQKSFLDGDWSGFENSPDYKFALDQGLKLSDRSAAARGGLLSVGHSGDLMRLGQGLASQNANNYWDKLAGRAGQGMVGAQNLGALGSRMASNIGNAYGNIGQARASSYANQAYNNANLGSQLGGYFNQWWNQRGKG